MGSSSEAFVIFDLRECCPLIQILLSYCTYIPKNLSDKRLAWDWSQLSTNPTSTNKAFSVNQERLHCHWGDPSLKMPGNLKDQCIQPKPPMSSFCNLESSMLISCVQLKWISFFMKISHLVGDEEALVWKRSYISITSKLLNFQVSLHHNTCISLMKSQPHPQRDKLKHWHWGGSLKTYMSPIKRDITQRRHVGGPWRHVQ